MKRRLCRPCVVTLLFIAMASQLHGRVAAVKGIDKNEAESLLRAYLRSKGYDTKTAKLDIEPGQQSQDSEFYLFAAYVDTPQRLVTIGSYGVNSKTGDIWERIGCKRVESPAIRSKQRQIRKSSGLSRTDLKRLRDANPCF